MRNLITKCGVYFARKNGSIHGYNNSKFEEKDAEMRDICNITQEEKERNKKIASKMEKRKAEQDEPKPLSMSGYLYKKEDKEKQESQKKPKHTHKPISFDI